MLDTLTQIRSRWGRLSGTLVVCAIAGIYAPTWAGSEKFIVRGLSPWIAIATAYVLLRRRSRSNVKVITGSLALILAVTTLAISHSKYDVIICRGPKWSITILPAVYPYARPDERERLRPMRLGHLEDVVIYESGPWEGTTEHCVVVSVGL